LVPRLETETTSQPLLTYNVGGAPGHQRPNVDGFTYIHYAATPYSVRTSATYLLPFGKVWLGSVIKVLYIPFAVCNARNEAERKIY